MVVMTGNGGQSVGYLCVHRDCQVDEGKKGQRSRIVCLLAVFIVFSLFFWIYLDHAVLKGTHRLTFGHLASWSISPASQRRSHCEPQVATTSSQLAQVFKTNMSIRQEALETCPKTQET